MVRFLASGQRECTLERAARMPFHRQAKPALPAASAPTAAPIPPVAPPAPPTPPPSRSQTVPLERVPLITTFVNRFVPGCDDVIETEPGRWRFMSRSQEAQRQRDPSRGDRPLLHSTRTVQDAFGNHFTGSDEHFCLYALASPDGRILEKCARFTTAALADWGPFASALQGAQLVGSLLSADFDLPNKGDWSDHLRVQATELFQRLQATGSVLASPSVFYTTAHGFRVAYFLSEPVPVGGVGGMHDLLIGLIVEAIGLGLNVDVNCIDWTRLFRLSRVWRRSDDPKDPGHPTWKADYFRQSWGRVDLNTIEPAPADGGYLVHHPSAFTPVSALSEEEVARRRWSLARPECVVLKKYLGHAPGVGAGPSKRDIGPGADAGNPHPLVVDAHGKMLPSTAALKKMLERAATPSKVRDGDPMAAWALGVIFQGSPLFEGIATGAEGMHRALGNLCYAVCRVVGERLDPESQLGNVAFLHAIVYRTALVANGQRPADKRDSDAAIYAESWRFFAHHYRRALGWIEHKEGSKSEVEEIEHARALNAFSQQHDELERLKESLEALTVNQCPEAKAWIEQHARRMYLIECHDGTGVLQRTLDGQLKWTHPWGNKSAITAMIRDSGLEHFHASSPAAKPGSLPVYKPYTQLMDEYGIVASSLKASRRIKLSGPELRWNNGAMDVTFVEKWGGMRTDVEPMHDEGVDGWLRAMTTTEEMYQHLCDWLHFYPQLEHRICALYLYGASDIGKSVLGKALKNLTEFGTSAPIEMAGEDFQEAMVLSPLLMTEEYARQSRNTDRSLVDLLKKQVDGAGDALNRKGKARIHIDGYWRVFITGNDNQIIKPGREITQETQNALIPRMMFIDARKAGPAIEPYRKLMLPERWAEDAVPKHIMWLRHNHKVAYPGQRYAKDGIWSKEHDELMTTSKAGKLTMETVGKVLSDRNKAATMFRVHDGGLWVHLSPLSDAVREHVQGRDIDHEQVRQTMLQYSAADRESRAILNASKKVVKMMRLNPQKLFAYFYDKQMDCDFRAFVDNDTLWREWAPAEWVKELEGSPTTGAGPFRRAVTPPAPPAAASANGSAGPGKVVPFPTTGRQPLRK